MYLRLFDNNALSSQKYVFNKCGNETSKLWTKKADIRKPIHK